MIKRRHVFALVLFALSAAPCFADIYAFVDENGKAHFSDVPLDSRYELYMKTKRPEIVVTPAAAPAEAPTADSALFERPVPSRAASTTATSSRRSRASSASIRRCSMPW